MDAKVHKADLGRPETVSDRGDTYVAPPRTRRRMSFLGTILGLLVIAGIGYAIYHVLVPHPSTTQHGRPHEAAQAVGIATIARGTIEVEVEALGTVTPLATVTVKTQINGQLQAVGFKEGQIVNKGDFLAQIDPRPYEVLEHQYEAQLAHDQALLAEAKVDLTRYQTLAKDNSIAKQQADDQFYVVQQDEGTVKVDQAQIDAQKLNLTYCRIVAPVAGRVGLRQVDPGNYVQTSDSTGLVVLTQLQPISVVFSLPETDIDEVTDAMKANPALVAVAYDQANVKTLATGKIETLDNVIDTTTGMVKARAIFENKDNGLFPNQFVNIHLHVKTLSNTIVVPASAVQRGAPGTFVYRVEPDNTVSVRKVTLGPTQGDRIAVTKGLAEGDRVVIDGTDRLHAGAKITVSGATTSTTTNPRGQHEAPAKSAP